MSSADRSILLHLFADAKKLDYPQLSDPDFFEIFVPFHYLKHHDLDYADVEQGIVDGPNDGGLDSVYCLCDGKLISEINPASVRKNPEIALYLFTNKFQDSFPTGVIGDVRSTLRDLLEFDQGKLASSFENYNDEVWDKFVEFRQFYLATASRFPELKIQFVYATASSGGPDSGVATRLAQIESDLAARFSGAKLKILAADARELLTSVREPPDEVRSLQISGNSVSLPKGPSYVALTSLTDYFTFILRPNRTLEQRLFEDNVRDYEGDVEVNKEIGITLSGQGENDFWWLNNGVSIICDTATLSGNQLQIKNPKIVNGLQTSRQIYEHFSSLLVGSSPDAPPPKDDRLILVRCISAQDESARADIIRATNRQTPIAPAQLVATSFIHKDIELHFRVEGKYYERRKNYWKNQGKSKSEIITVTDLAQAVITAVSGRPYTARARPGSLLKESNNVVFDPSYDLKVFSKAIDLVRATDTLISDVLPACGVRDRNNIKYHVAAKVVFDSCGGKFSAARFLGNQLVPPEKREAIIKAVYAKYVEMGASDRIAKSEDLWDAVKALKVN